MPDIELDIGLQLLASVETLSTQLAKQEYQDQQRAQAFRQIPLTAPQATASPWIIDYPDTLKAKTGYFWSIRRLTLSGFSAGTAIAYINGATAGNTVVGEPAAFFTAAGSQYFARGTILLHPDDRLIIQGTGITGVVQVNGAADCFEQRYLPDYID